LGEFVSAREKLPMASNGDIMKRRGHMNTSVIQSHPQIMMGKPVVAGTRITVEAIVERPGAGETPEQIVAAHPRLTRQAVLAAAAGLGARKSSAG
jgi:uncharacterized protein (DUF433 family)